MKKNDKIKLIGTDSRWATLELPKVGCEGRVLGTRLDDDGLQVLVKFKGKAGPVSLAASLVEKL